MKTTHKDWFEIMIKMAIIRNFKNYAYFLKKLVLLVPRSSSMDIFMVKYISKIYVNKESKPII